MTYDPDALDESAQDVDVTSELSAVITNTETTDAEDIFGDSVEGDGDKEMLVVEATTDNDQEIEAIFSMPNPENPDMSWMNPTFKLARFKHQYGGVPREDMEVKVSVNENGFLGIYLPDTVPVGSE